MEVLTDCTRDELIGAPFKNYFTDPERAEKSIKQVLREKKVTDYELTARARDGKETVVSFNATTFYDRDRKLQGVFAAARDITERKRLDQVLREKNVELESARAVAEKANLAKSEFLSSMSHELRSPLNAILGFAQLLESAAPPPTPSQKESVDQILKAGWYLLELINEILDLALIESGRLSLELEPLSLGDTMLECQTMIEPQAQKSGLGIPVITAALVNSPEIKAIGYPGGQLLGNVPTYMQAAGKKPGDVFSFGFDTSPQIVEGFKGGWVQLTADQQPFLQGYLPILSLCASIVYGLAPMNVDTGAGFVTPDNYEIVAKLATEGLR
jgi:PAS domain S-box-containing protein